MNAQHKAHSGVARKIFLAVILVLIAVDALKVMALVRLLARSECSLPESLAVISVSNVVESTAQQLAPKITLQKTEAGLDLWNTPQGGIWDVHGDAVLPYLMAEQQHDIYEPAGHEVRRGDIVLDCGANIGVFTKKALSRGAGLVVAIEPAPHTLEALRRNFEGEIRSGRVIVYPKGVWDHDAELELAIDEENQAANSLVRDRGHALKIRVPLTTIDKIVSELKLPRVDFIKMDIEGAEKQAIKGASNTIQRFRPRMSLSSEHLYGDYAAILALVKSIEPRYRYQGCDCESMRSQIKARVLAFDPVP
jgi:FkbM family methyltransferase